MGKRVHERWGPTVRTQKKKCPVWYKKPFFAPKKTILYQKAPRMVTKKKPRGIAKGHETLQKNPFLQKKTPILPKTPSRSNFLAKKNCNSYQKTHHSLPKKSPNPTETPPPFSNENR